MENVKHRIDKDLLTTFKEQNKNFDLETANLLDASIVEQLVGLGKGEDNITLAKLKGLQRLTDITQDETHALNLYNEGLESCFQVAELSKQQFIDQYQEAFGGSSSLAAATHERALGRQSQLLHHYLNIRSHHEPHYKALQANNLTAATAENFSGVPSYQDLFGSLDYCQVASARAIFSPAAYLLDLIRFKDKQIDDSEVDNLRKLSTRRPDLEAIKLDSENTNTLIPKLEIANEVLVNQYASLNGISAASQREKEQKVFEALSTATYPFKLPFHLSLTQIRTYLKHLKADLSSIWEDFTPPASKAKNTSAIAQERLAISAEEYQLYTTPQVDQAAIQAAYGLAASINPLDAAQGLGNIAIFLSKTGLTHDLLRSLLENDLSEAEISAKVNKDFFINNTGEAKDPIAIAGDQLQNLTLARLDRIHRFIRLANKVNFSFTDLNWVLQSQGAQSDGTYQAREIDDAMIQLLSQLVTWQKTYANQSLNALNTLIGSIKDFGSNTASGLNFCQQTFNQLHANDTFKLGQTQWAIHGNDDTNNQLAAQLVAGLGVSEQELVLIADQMYAATQASTSPSQTDNPAKLTLDLPTLSALYRFSLVTKLTQHPVQETMALLKYMGAGTVSSLSNIASPSSALAAVSILHELILHIHWLQQAGIGSDALACILENALTSQSSYYLGHNDKINFINQLYQSIQPSLLTQQVLEANKELAQIAPELGRFLRGESGGKTVFVDAHGLILLLPTQEAIKHQLKQWLPTKEADNEALVNNLAETIMSVLTSADQLQRQAKYDQVANKFGVPSNTAAEVIRCVKIKLQKEDKTLRELLLAPYFSKQRAMTDTDQLPEEVNKAFAYLSLYSCLASQLKLTHVELRFLINDSLLYNVADITTLTLADLEHLYQYKQLTERYQDRQYNFISYLASNSNRITKRYLIDLLGVEQTESLWQKLQDLGYINAQGVIQDTFRALADEKAFASSIDLSLSDGMKSNLYSLLALLGNPMAIAAATQELATFTQWDDANDPKQLALLFQHLGPATTPASPGYGTLQGLLQVAQCIEKSTQVGINMGTLLALYQLVPSKVATLEAPTLQSGALFGFSVSLSSDGIHALVGAYGENVSGKSDAGRAYLYAYQGGQWKQQDTLQAPTLQTNARFGWTVSLSSDGTRALVGAYREDVSGKSNAGRAYLYAYQGNQWTLEKTLQAPTRQANAYFGVSVSLSSDGTHALVGAHGEDISGKSNAGRAYLYAYQGGQWTLEKTLQAPTLQGSAQFGRSVTLSSDGTRALVGAHGEDISGKSNAGRAYLYAYQGGQWTLEKTLQAPTLQTNAYFGYPVTLSSDGTRALVGAYGEDVSGKSDAGRAYLYAYQGGQWTLEKTLQAPTLQGSARFGWSVSLSSDGTRALVGAYPEDVGGKSDAGRVYLYAYQGGQWTLKQDWQAPNLQTSARFGRSVTLSSDGRCALVGASEEDIGGKGNAGRTYVYDYPGGKWQLKIGYDQYAQVANTLLGAVQGKYQETAWQEVNKPIQVTLNEQQRDALVAALLYELPQQGLSIETQRDLYEYLLIDVAVSGLVETSRIKEALGCLQLYVNRCRMNLEAGISYPDRADLERNWAWIKNYRVWEANRKTFLYPENYTEPELRTDKTAIYQQLIESLQQTHIDKASVSQAVHGYLDSFAEVANLQYAGSYWHGPSIAPLQAPKPQSNARFGVSVTLSSDGTRALVGAYAEDVGGVNNAGRVYVYAYAGNQWQLEQALQAPTPQAYAYFGESVSLSSDGTRALIGAHNEDISGVSNAGRSYLYAYQGNQWTLEQTLQAPTPQSSANFGESVSLSRDGTRALIGAYRENIFGYSSAGRVHVYAYQGNQWALEQTLQAPTPQAYAYFGWSVSLSSDGTRALVGAYAEDVGGVSNAGRAYLYAYQGNEWTLLGEPLEAPMPQSGTSFGWSVSLSRDGTRALVGAHAEDVGGVNNAGRAYLCAYQGNEWTLEQTLQAPTSEVYANFGRSVSLSSDGTRALVGAYAEDVGGVSNAGRAYLYAYQGGVWTLEQTLQAPTLQSNTYFGKSVTLSRDGTRALVGIFYEDVAGKMDAGRVYCFTWPKQPNLFLLNRTNTQPYQYYYRQADFMADPNRQTYIPKHWTPWSQIQLTIPAKSASPIYAFGKLFVFWVEIKPGPSDRNDAGKEIRKRFQATICYSFYQFNKSWVAPQTVDDAFLLPSYVDTQEETKAMHWQKVYVTLLGEQLIVRYPQAVSGTSITQAYQWSIGAALRASARTTSSGYSITLPLPNDTFSSLPAETINYPVSNSDLSILDTGQSAYLGIPGYNILQEDMQTTPKGELKGNTQYIDQQYVQLTDLSRESHGNALEYTLALGDYFVVDFEFWIGGGTGADALYFYAFKQSTPSTEEDATNGYIIAYSEWDGRPHGWGSIPYVGVRYGADSWQKYNVPDSKKLDSSTWRKTQIIFNQGKFEIFLDGELILAYTDTAYSSRDLTGKLGGFGARTGSYTDYHRIKNINVYNRASTYIRLNSTTIHTLSGALFAHGVDGLLRIKAQLTPEDSFTALEPQAAHVAAPYPSETLDFGGANGLYYWELFFHTPFLIAKQFNTHQQFELAQQWYQYLYNPTIDPNEKDPDTGVETADHYWRFVGLRSNYNPTLQEELERSKRSSGEELRAELTNTSQIERYHQDPFEPHAIAQLRPIAYQKTLVMHYIDNLLDWGDDLFRQNTREKLVEATMHYVTAYGLLGKKPTNLGTCTLPAVETLGQIRQHYGKGNIPEFLIALENHLRTLPMLAGATDNPNNTIPNIYFGIPENEQFLGYWDRVQGRLYNIRHNLTIDGKPNNLPLFQPPINPMALIQAIAGGADVSSAVAAMQVPAPYYRFTYMIEKAKNVTNFVIQLGSSLLQALEKKDAEQLAQLRTTHEQALLTLTRKIKQDQQKAAEETVAALQYGQAGAKARLDHYTQLISQGYSAGEISQLTLQSAAMVAQGVSIGFNGAAIAGYVAPDTFGLANGGMDFGSAIAQGGVIADKVGNILNQASGLAGTVAQYQRREEDWELQKAIAQEDVSQLISQLAAAKLQVQIAAEELQVVEKNIEQTQAISQFLQDKFTDQDQYLWLVGQLATLYFQAYQLAHQLALAAQRAWQFEKAHEQSFIQPGYWNNLHKGLVAGEALMLGLMHLEKAYMDQDVRRLEITKSISLKALDSGALNKLKTEGKCDFDLSERLFDQDYPGHYSRQIKTMSLSLPAVLGPYQNIHATLTQTGNKTVVQPDANTIKKLLGVQGATTTAGALRTDGRANQQIALSQGVNDSGLFELTFQDARYLPFEGTGAVSSWQLAIPPAANPSVLDSLTDVIITLRYTALAGDAALQQAIAQEVYKDSSTKLS